MVSMGNNTVIIAIVCALALGLLCVFLFTKSKKEGFCAGTCVVRNQNSGCLEGAGRSDCPNTCPRKTYAPTGGVSSQYEQKYFIEGMDDRKTIANHIANKSIENMSSDKHAFLTRVVDHSNKYYDQRVAADNKGPAGFPFGSSPTGSNATTGDELRQIRNCMATNGRIVDHSRENFTAPVDLYDEFNEEPTNADKEDFTTDVSDCKNTTSSCGLPLSMSADRCADPNTYVYDRQIAVTSRSRTYGLGNYLMGDLPICPSAPTDSYGHDWFRPSARPSADLNAGALRFMTSDGASITNLTGDINVYRDDCNQSNVAVQYTLAS